MEHRTRGWIDGFIGILIFSFSLPATRVAVAAFDPIFLTVARAAIAGLLGAALLVRLQQRRPSRADLLPLLVTSLGVVIGFPLLTALALQLVTASHAIVFVGLLPLTTATFGVLRAGDRPRPRFWIFAVLGSAFVVGFALLQSGVQLAAGDLLMLGAIVACGLGYAEGGRLSRHLGGWQVICWSLVLALPIMLLLTVALFPADLAHVDAPAWIGLAYVSLFSMLIGFVFWYRGLAEGGVAAVGQLQLLQPFFSLLWAALLLGETVGWTALAATAGVVACVAGARNAATR